MNEKMQIKKTRKAGEREENNITMITLSTHAKADYVHLSVRKKDTRSERQDW